MRRSKGQLGVVLIILMILATLLLGSIAVDSYHVQMAQAELQNAADAAALAGGQDLWKNFNNAESDAYRVADLNQADGVFVSNNSPEVTISATAVRPDPATDTQGTVTVIATKRVRHLLAPLYGRNSDVIKVHAVAGTRGSLHKLYKDQAMIFAVSWDAVPDVPGGKALSTYKLGDSFTMYIEAQGPKNAAYTTFTHAQGGAAYVRDAFYDVLGVKDQPDGFVPSIAIGDNIRLMNGNLGQNMICNEPGYSALLNAPFIVIPVISGNPPFNQTAKVINFIGMKVTSIDRNQHDPNVVNSITGILVDPQVLGEGSPGGNAITPGPIQLID